MQSQARSTASLDLSRRRFVNGLALGGAMVGLGLWRQPAWSQTGATSPTMLSGTQFELDIGATPVNLTGSARIATAVNGQLPAPILHWREGDTITLRVTNRLPTSSSIHWHGILLPSGMDGVPGLSFDGIAPGETFAYQFEVRQSGTFWYHSHTRFQEQTGLYGPIVITPREGERFVAEREHVVLLSDWTDETPEQVFAKLKKMSDFYNFNEPTAVDFARDAARRGLKAAFDKRKMWNRMRMSPTDLSDVTGYTFTYLMNGTTPAGNWTGLFKPGEKVRLRFINGSATSIFDVRIPGLKMRVVAADGQDIEPVSVDEFRISVAETYDVIVEPQDEAYTLFAQPIDRTGYARGTLAPRAGMQAEVPRIDPPHWLTMTDMMGSMAMMKDGKESMPGMRDMDHSSMKPMDHSSMKKMHHDSGFKVRHAKTEYGPGVDMRVDMPRTNLDDPGINLRNNGRRVLTYADLHTIGGPLDPREPGREIELHLTGNMERFMWSFDGQKFSEALPIHFRYGERLRIVLVNDTMMTHPIHLHGMWSEVESPDGSFQVRKHTVNVQPAQRVTYLVNADARGRWAYHCHLLYHMEAGMFRQVVVS
ncbi:MAG: copper resistance system multicopper oxidase [Betaproteobacteria bacterium]